MKSIEFVKSYVNPLFTRSYWQMLGDYVGIGRHKSSRKVSDQDSLAAFVGTRASHVSQTALYGYLRTRAGTRFPEMFENPDILQSINIAKWHIWLACVSDLSIFVGQCIHQSGKIPESTIQQLLPQALAQVLAETGKPEEAGKDFVAAREKIVQRIATCDWSEERDDDSVFSQSPDALFYWAPIADELKQRDEAIVKNSVRYRWIAVRYSLRKLLDCDALAETLRAAEL
ncbi:MAG: esterase [Gammaproteobacteria bacterium]|nr:esterase [Gammaproteobacteria bacterium]